MNSIKMAQLEIILELVDEQSTINLAAILAGKALIGDVIALSGDLGSGKTTFARSFIKSKQNTTEEIPSPTYTLLQTYETNEGIINHYDFYRLKNPEEAYELDIEDAFNSKICLIEWPQKLGSLIPSERLEVRLDFLQEPQSRRITLIGYQGWSARLKAIKLHMFTGEINLV